MTFVTYIGQVVNFIIFVVILYYLLYKPVGRILKQRKDEMEAELREAEKLRAEAQAARDEVAKREQELEAQREGVLKKAADQANASRKEILKEAEDQARAKLERFRRIMKQERDELLDNISHELRATILKTTASVFGDDCDRFTDRGIERVEALLQEMPEDDLADTRKALAEADGCAKVRSAGPLHDKQQNRLKKAIQQKLNVEEVKLEVTEDPSLIGGIEVVLGHVNLAAHWRGLIAEALALRKQGTAPQDATGEPPEVEQKEG